MAEAAALTAAALGVETFEYNRQNYMYDRQQKLTKDYTEMNFRIEQAAQWREDVRDIVDLQEKKSKTYCLVAVMTLGFSMSLWCQGRLPIGTPTWVMLGNQVAAGGGFAFLLMTIWLGIYASVTAQGYHCRMLTQLVRLPIPSWQEVEGCRTYGSSFEKCEGRQMFRVPFVMGSQEGLVTQGQSSAVGPASGAGSASALPGADKGEPGGASASKPASARTATDPWGLEARRDDTYELGCPYGRDVARLRHIKLIRHAAHFWQSYDAFARISLTIGINQVILGLIYFILGNMCLTLEAPFAAFAGVFALVACRHVIELLDCSLPPGQAVIATISNIVGPACACIACYQLTNSQHSIYADARARCWAAVAFASHGWFFLSLVFFSGVKKNEAGDHIATGFKSVLWSDIFGWTYGPDDDDEERTRHHGPASTGASRSQLGAQAGEGAGLHAAAMESDRSAADRECTHPGLETVSYDTQKGDSCPDRYEDHRPIRAADDMRGVLHAPDCQSLDPKNPQSDFYNASSFGPHSRNPADDDHETHASRVEEIITGHDIERPSVLPWRVFKSAAVLLSMVWFAAAVYQILDATGVVTFARFEAAPIIGRHSIPLNVSKMVAASPIGLMQLWSAGVTRVHPAHTVPEQLVMHLPIANMEPRGLSCDADGQNFALTDGLSTFLAKLEGTLDFQDAEPCAAILGEALDDTAIVCEDGMGGTSTGCQVLVLHRSGNRVAACPTSKTAKGAGRMAAVSQEWLQHNHEEQVASLLVDSSCRRKPQESSMACTSVGTTHGRVAHLQHSKDILFPRDVSPEDGVQRGTWQPGMVRAFNSRFIGVLQPQQNSIQVLDVAQGLSETWIWKLPSTFPIRSFCTGGGYVYFLSDEPSAKMWRLPVPAELAV